MQRYRPSKDRGSSKPEMRYNFTAHLRGDLPIVLVRRWAVELPAQAVDEETFFVGVLLGLLISSTDVVDRKGKLTVLTPRPDPHW